MNTHTDKMQKNKSQSVANAVYQKNSERPDFQFLDNRPQSIIQRKLEELISGGRQASKPEELETTMGISSAKNQQTTQKKHDENDHRNLEQEADLITARAENNSFNGVQRLSNEHDTSDVVQRAIGMEFETKIPVYGEKTGNDMAKLWRQLLDSGPEKEKTILASMNGMSIKPGPNITEWPEFGLRMDVDSYRGVSTYNDNLDPPLLLGGTGILELVSEPIDSRTEFDKMQYLFKDFMKLFSGAWNTPVNRDVEGVVFGPADDKVYTGLYNNHSLPYNDLKARRENVYNKFDNSGSLQVNFSFDPRRIYEVFRENADSKLGLPEASTIGGLQKDPYWQPVTNPASERVSRNKYWEEDIAKAKGSSQLLILRTRKKLIEAGKEYSIESLAGLRSVFLFWAYNLIIGKRNEPSLNMPKNIPAFLMKTSFAKLTQAALTQEEFSFLDKEKSNLLGELVDILKIRKELSDPLYNSNPGISVVSDLLGTRQLPAGNNSTVRDISVRDVDQKEQHLVPDEAKTADKIGKSGVVFESRYILVTDVDNLSAIFDTYQKWVEKHSQELWKD